MFAAVRYLFVFSTLFLASFSWSQSQSEVLQRALGFNAYIQQGFNAHSSDIQGKLAAGSDVSLYSYGVASSIEVDPVIPTLISGGNISYDNGMLFSGSILAAGSVGGVAQSVISGMDTGASVTGNADINIDFAADFQVLAAISQTLAVSTPTGEVEYKWGGTYLTGDCSSEIQVFEINGAQLFQSTSLNLNCVPSSSTILFNISGTTAGLTNIGLSHLQSQVSRILYNFYEASELSFSSVGIKGSVLAPLADVNTSWGHIDGTMIAKSWNGPMELHHIPFAGNLPALESPNSPPEFLSVPVTTVAESQNYSYLIEVSDPDDDQLTLSLVNGPAGIILGNAILSWQTDFDDAGTYPVTLSVSDGEFAVEQSFEISVSDVNRAPQITPVPDFNLIENELFGYQLQAQDPDGNALVYTSVNGPAGMSIEESTGSLIWQTNFYSAGSYSVTVQVSDGELHITDTFSINVSNLNQPPMVEPVGDIVVNEGESFSVVLIAGDDDLDILFYSLLENTTAPVVLDAGGEVSWQTNFDDAGSYLVAIAVTDGVDQATAEFAVTVNNVNRIPVIQAIPSQEVQEREVFNYQVIANDPDSDDLTFSITSGPEGLVVDGNTGEISWATDESDIGNHDVVVEVSDGNGGEASHSFVIAVLNVNDAPVAQDLSISTSEDTTVTIELFGSDVDGDVLTHSLESQPQFGNLTGELPNLTYSPDPDFNGEDAFSYKVSDGEYDSVAAVVVISVIPVNDAPVITSSPELSAIENTLYQYQITADDLDNDTLIFSMTTGPQGMTVEPITGLVNWLPNQGSAGDHNIIFRASDGDESTEQSFVLSVQSVNQLPVVNSQPPLVAVENSLYQYQIVGYDPDGDELAFSLGSGPESMMISTQGLVTWEPDSLDQGQHEIILRVDDQRGGDIVQQFTLQVMLIADLTPEIVSVPEIIINERELYDYLIQVAYPLPDEPLAFSNERYSSEVSLGSSNGEFGWGTEDIFTGVVEENDFSCTGFAHANSPYLSAATWKRVVDTYETHPGNHIWEIHEGGLLVEGEGNGKRVLLLSDYNISNQVVMYELRVEGGDNDTVGIAWGYRDLDNFYLLNWSNSPVSGFRVLEYNGIEEGRQVFSHYWNKSFIWRRNVNYQIFLDYRPAKTSLYVFNADTGVLQQAVTINDDTLPDGRFGYSASSQGGIKFRSKFVDRKPKSDLIVKELTFQEVNHATGAGTLSATIKNRGANASSTQTTTELSVGTLDVNQQFVASSTLPSKTVPGLNPGDELQLQWTNFAPSAGNLVVQATVDPTRIVVEECNEFNNTLTVPLMEARVADSRGASDDQTWSVQVKDVNDSPSIISIAPQYAFVGEEYSYNVIAIDPDVGDGLHNEIIEAPINASFFLGSNRYFWVPEQVHLGTAQQTTIRYTDLRGAYVEETFFVEVHNKPKIISEPGPVAYSGLNYQYQIQAEDEDGDAISYELVSGPAEMSVNSVTGLLEWTPATANAYYTVIVAAQDAREGYVEQEFYLAVLQQGQINTAPSLQNNTPPLSVENGGLYYYRFTVQDTDGTTPIYKLIEGPESMAIDSNTGELWWRLPFTTEPTFPVKVQVYDRRGGYDTYSYEIALEGVSNLAPEIISIPETIYVPGELYSYQISAVDPDMDLLTYHLSASPRGTSIAEDGLLTWLPDENYTYNARVTVEVKDSVGNIASQSFVVFPYVTNNPPSIESSPQVRVSLGEEYNYQLLASDVDGDNLSYQLSVAPTAMQIDNNGLITWSTALEDSGSHDISVIVDDRRGGLTMQSWTLVVGNNAAPLILSEPDFYINPGNTYIYSVIASDAENEPLSYMLASAPEGMSIDVNGVVSWATGAEDLGPHAIAVTISDDSGASTTQTWTLTVTDNLPPLITSAPLTYINENENYSYQVQAQDPENQNVRFELLAVPSGMTIDTLGLISWSPLQIHRGSNDVVLRAIDENGAFSQQAFRIIVQTPSDQNRPPELGPNTPLGNAVVSHTYRYQSDIFDPDGNQLFFSMQSAPNGMTVSEAGMVSWTPTINDLGTHDVVLRANDGQYFIDLHFSVSVDETIRPLEVTAFIEPQFVAENQPTTITVLSSGGINASAPLLQVDGEVVSLSNNQATVSSDVIGVHSVVVSVSDDLGSATYSTYYSVVDPMDTTAPDVHIHSPESSSTVTSRIDVVATVEDDNLIEYRLYMRGANDEQDTLIAVGNSSQDNEVIAQFDPTQVTNGIYHLLLQGIDAGGQSSIASTSVVVDGDLKVGNFSFTVEDINIPMSGIPIRVTRTYDSRRKHEDLDFGYGWSVSYQDVKIEESSEPTASWYQENLDVLFQVDDDLATVLQGTCTYPQGNKIVTVTMPDGKVEKFVARAEIVGGGLQSISHPDCFLVAGRFVNLHFDAQGDTQSTLELAESQQFYLSNSQNGNLVEDILETEPANITRYKLTTRTGYQYLLNQNFGIEMVLDPNGYTLTYSNEGIFHSSGKSVTFVRDFSGRITDVIDPKGNTRKYIYGSRGDLLEARDPLQHADNVSGTRYIYNGSHGLVDIFDPSNRKLLKNIYDENGRLVAQEDGEGNRKDFEHLLDERSSVVTDRDGRTTVFNYDEEGNVTEEVMAITDGSYSGDIVTTYAYDANGNETSKSIGDSEHTWTSEYNANNDLLYAIDPENNRVDYLAYNSLGQETRIQDELGRITEMAYDASGNLTSITMPTYFDPVTQSDVTPTASNVVNARGQVTSTTDLRGNVTSYTWYPQGHAWEGQKRTESSSATGTMTFTYDTNNNMRTETRERTVDGVVIEETVTYDYDARDRLIRTTYPDASFTETEYDLVGNVDRERDRNGVWTDYTYDTYGRLTTTLYADGSAESRSYTAEGLLESVTDVTGHTTRYEYDDASRQWKTIFHDESYTETRYTPQGWVQYEWDEERNLTEYEYDLAGKRTAVLRHYTDANGVAQTQRHAFTYYKNGELHTETDANGHTTTYILNNLDQRVETQFENSTTTQMWYDAMGAKIRDIDQSLTGTDYRYDALGRLEEVQPDVAFEGVRVPVTAYTYDEVGNKLTQTDANGHTTTWIYDYFGRVLTRQLPELMTESFIYVDGLGCTNAERANCANVSDPRTVVHTDFNGDVITTAHDILGRVATVHYSKDNQTERYTWYANGQLETVTDQHGTTTYYYDDRDRLETEIRPNGEQVDYSYDAAGNRTSVVITRGLDVSSSTAYTHDELNRLDTVIDSSGTTIYSYDAVGNLDTVTYPNGLVTDYDYNTINQLTDVYTWGANSNLVKHYNYGLLPTGRRETISELDGRITTYGYDGLYRLTSESIVDTVNGNYESTYEYDWVGNRTYETVNGVQTAYTYDDNDRLEQSSGTSYVYDNNGNTQSSTLDGFTTTYTWDGKNKLVATTGTSSTASYTYNHNGIRTSKTENGLTTHYVVDENRDYAQVLEEVVDGTTAVAYTYGHDLINQSRNSSVSYFHYDGLGSTRALSDAGGSLTDSYDYEAFGEILNQTGTTENNYLFTGEQFDQTLNQYYLRARYYDQGIGRFIQMDTFEGVDIQPETIHKYSYVGNEPANFVDLSGNFQSLTETQLSLQISGTLALAVIVPPALQRSGFGIGTKTGLKCANRVLQSKMGRYTKPVSQKDKECDRELNQMRVQFQISPATGGGVTLLTWAVPVLAHDDRGVTVVDMEVNMTALFYSRPTGSPPNGWPRSLDTPTIKLMAAQSKYMRRFSPYGISGRTSNSETFMDGGYQYRIDIENIRGTNLRFYR